MNNVLIVEDNTYINDTWVEYFNDLKYDGFPFGEIHSFETSDEANKIIVDKEISFYVGIIDIRSPGILNGLDLIENISAKINHIILTTGYQLDYEDEIKALSEHINIYAIYYKKEDPKFRMEWRKKYLNVLFDEF